MTTSKKIPTIAEAFREIRAEQTRDAATRYGADTGGIAYWPRQAMEAMRRARWTVEQARRDAALPLELPRYADTFDADPEETALPFGDALRVRLVYDEDAQNLLEDYDITRGRQASHAYASDGWVSRDGSTIYGTDYRGHPYTATIGECSGYDFAQYVQDGRERGMPRHAAYLRARVRMQKDADFLQRAMNDQLTPCGYVVEIVDKDGAEIAEESCWGYESEDAARDEAASVARVLIEYRMRDLERIAADRDEAARGARIALRTLAAEAAAMRNANAPTLCAMLREKLQDMRNAARDATVTARRARAAIRTYAAAGFIADRHY
jgi:hypothetical protein